MMHKKIIRPFIGLLLFSPRSELVISEPKNFRH